MGAAAVLSTGSAADLDSCRQDVLNFLRTLSWRVASVEVERWRSEGLLHAVRRWETVTTDLEGLAQEIAQFVIENRRVKTGAIVLVRG
jgi:hypothetical protein